MIPLRIVESDREGFEEPVVEIWRDDDFVGMVFWDGDVAVVQVYPDEDGGVHDLEMGDVFRILGLAEAIVTPEEFRFFPDEYGETGFSVGRSEGEDDWEDEHPATIALATEFDSLAVYRSPDGEGFFRPEAARDFIARCDELDLAVVELEGFDFDGIELKPRPNLVLTVALPGMNDWRIFRPAANSLSRSTLDRWPNRASLALSFVVQQPDGETFVA